MSDQLADDRWTRIWDLFHEALAKTPVEREAFLDAACGGDGTLRREVVSLIDAHEHSDGLLSASPLQAPSPGGADTLVGRRIGPYLIQRVVGAGGMGIVCDAMREGEVTRRVALKLIRFGMESREVIARFTMERQALALMNHPNIATAYEVGATDDGRPYFVMEYVEGKPITEYCDAGRLSIRERLELFLQVCDAVQHAHQKGIIHRDIKPSNVLVGTQDGKPVPKIIDFGVAKAVGRRINDRSFYTSVGNIIGTPEYMSPEQAGVDGLDVDTRADIYSLGVLLFELLVGVPPVDPARLRSAGLGELERLLFVEDRPRPSDRLSALGVAGEQAGTNRKTSRTALLRELRGDLDWITAKAMDRDRARRYATASELAADVSRYLAHEPVHAGPPSTTYLMRKFVARHRRGVAVTAAVTLAFAITTAVYSARTTTALRTAEAERQVAEQVSTFLVDLFRVSNPGEARGSAVTARELLDKGAKEIAAGLQDQPGVRARLMETIGTVYSNLGLYGQAETLLRGALELRRSVLGREHLDVAHTLNHLGTLQRQKGSYREAADTHREALAMRRKLLDPDHLDVADSLNNLGVALRMAGDYDAALEAYKESLAIKEKHAGPADAVIASTLVNLGSVSKSKGDLAAAEAYYRRALEMRRALLGDDHLDVARARNDLGSLYFEKADHANAQPLFRQALARMRAILGDEHPDVGTIMNNLAVSLARTGDLESATDLHLQTLAIRRKMLGEHHPEVAVTLNNIGTLLRQRRDLAGATAHARQAVEIFRIALGEKHPNYAQALHNLGEILYEQRSPETEAVVREALERKRAALPRGHPSIDLSLSLAGQLAVDRGDYAAAEPMLTEAYTNVSKALPPAHPRVVTILNRLVKLYEAIGNRRELERHRALLDAAKASK